MFLKLRIFFTILAAICAAAVIPVGTFLGFVWALVPIIAAFLFYFIMLYFKAKQEETAPTVTEEKSESNPPQTPNNQNP